MSTIIVDGTVQDAITEYGIVLDAMNKTSSTQELSKLITSFKDEEELIEFLNARSLDIILELNEKDLEPIFNLYLYLIKNLKNGFEENLKNSNLTEKIINKVVSTTDSSNSNKYNNIATIMISVLTTIFNILPVESAQRLDILKSVLKVVQISNNLKLILDIELDTYLKWLSPCCNDEQVVSFYLELIELFSKDYPTHALELNEFLVSKFEPLLTEKHLNEFLIKSFNDENKLDLSNYNSSNTSLNISKLSRNFKELLTFYNAKDLTSFETFYNANDVEFASINYEILKLKLQIIKLITTCYGINKIQYQELKPILQIESTEELEKLIIYSIKKNFIQGKLNQFKQSLEINHVKYLGDFNLENWKSVQLKLNHWKTSLKEIKENIDSSKKK